MKFDSQSRFESYNTAANKNMTRALTTSIIVFALALISTNALKCYINGYVTRPINSYDTVRLFDFLKEKVSNTVIPVTI